LTIKYYNNHEHRRQLILDGKSRGESVIHDDYLEENKGRLTLEIIADNVIPPDKTDDELLLEFYKKEINYEDLLDFLTRQYLLDHATRWDKFKRLFT